MLIRWQADVPTKLLGFPAFRIISQILHYSDRKQTKASTIENNLKKKGRTKNKSKFVLEDIELLMTKGKIKVSGVAVLMAVDLVMAVCKER